jgi:short-subunit dehydrogenase
MKRAVIIGASSGMGLELAHVLGRAGWAVGLAARRATELQALARNLPAGAALRTMDIADTATAAEALKELISDLGGMDLMIISAGADHFNPDPRATLDRAATQRIIDINVSGFCAMADTAYEHFAHQGRGHIAGISSIAGLRGSAEHPAYSASKAFVSNYLEGLRLKADKSGLAITVTDIRPGNVETPMSAGQPGRFWVAPARQAAEQIFGAIQKKKHIAYITRRWVLIARLLRVLPLSLLKKL